MPKGRSSERSHGSLSETSTACVVFPKDSDSQLSVRVDLWDTQGLGAWAKSSECNFVCDVYNIVYNISVCERGIAFLGTYMYMQDDIRLED